MAVGDEYPVVTKVAVLEQRRLIRQAMSIWLASRQDVEFIGSGGGINTIAQMCQRESVDLVLVGLGTEYIENISELASLISLYPKVKFVAIVNDSEASDIDLAIESGFGVVVPNSAGLESILLTFDPETGDGATVAAGPTEATSGPLTPREAEVLSLVGLGSTSHDISEQLGISRSTVANHKERIFNKLQVRNQAHAVARAVSMGIIDPVNEDKARQVS